MVLTKIIAINHVFAVFFLCSQNIGKSFQAEEIMATWVNVYVGLNERISWQDTKAISEQT